MFELTHKFNSVALLKPWLDHCERVGLPAGIVAHRGHVSVWRSGTGIKGCGRAQEYYTQKPEGRLQESVCGFDEEWESKK